MNFGVLPTIFFLLRDKARNVNLRCERTLSAGTASAASLATLSPGSSARAIPAGVAALRSNQQCFLLKE
ncbi:hypothetical protein D0S48_10930 [Psychrobacillus sp. AK 1817]|nr:hypothetical protein D0S48_10930 [Psychrobacillus sp. AK 1817]